MGIRTGIASLLLAGTAMSVAQAEQASNVPEAAAKYASYQAFTDEVGPRSFRSADEIYSAVDGFAGYSSEDLTTGWIAFSALVASQDPEFRRSVRDIESYYGREAAIRSFTRGGGYARSLDGGNRAFNAAASTAEQDVERLNASARLMFDQYYSLQQYGWAKALIRNKDARVASIRRAQTTGRRAEQEWVTSLSLPLENIVATSTQGLALDEAASRVASSVRVPRFVMPASATHSRTIREEAVPLANNVTAIAALHVINAAVPGQMLAGSSMYERVVVRGCMNIQVDSLPSCVQGARADSDLTHCISRHPLGGVAECIGKTL